MQLSLLLCFFVLKCGMGLSQSENEVYLGFIEKGQHDTTRVIGFVELAKNYKKSKPEKALFYLDKAETLIQKKLAEGTKQKTFYLNRLTMVYNASGVVYRRFGNYPEALRMYTKALVLLETLDNKKVHSSALFNIGKLNHFLGKSKESLEYFNQSIAMRKEIGDSFGLINCYQEVGSIKLEQKEYREAEDYMRKSLSISREISNTVKLILMYGELSDVYLAQNKFSIARDSLYSAMAVIDASFDELAARHGYISIRLTKALTGLGDIREAITVAETSINVNRSLNNLNRLSELYQLAAEGYSSFGDFRESNRLLNLKIEADSVIQANNNTAEIVRIEMNYLFKKNKAADSLKVLNEKKISELELKQKNADIKVGRSRVFALTFGIIMLLVIVFFIYRNYRTKGSALKGKQRDVEQLLLKIKRESNWIDELITLNDNIRNNKVENTSEEIQKLVNAMRDNLVVDKHRQVQAKNIEVLTIEFREKLKSRYPSLTRTEIEMCELIRLELSNSEISRVRNISQNSARMARYRLKKKLQLEGEQTVFEVLKEI